MPALPYDPEKNVGNEGRTKDGLGNRAVIIPPGTAIDFEHYPKCVEVVSKGDLVYTPTKNKVADEVTVTGAPTGYYTKCAVRYISAATTATVIAIYDA